MKDVVLGVDLSINHGAFIVLAGGKLVDYFYVTDRQKVAKKSAQHGTYLFAAKLKDMHERGVLRLAFWDAYLAQMVNHLAPEHAGIEDYAYRIPMGAHQIGEVGGLFRLRAWRCGCKIRFHDPGSVKMFGAHDGSADKKEMAYQIQQRWEETREFANYSYETPKGAYTTIEEDLCDAYSVGKLVWLEVLLKRGEVMLKDLHPKEVQVFNRVTKRWPNSILDRDWLHQGGDHE